MAKNIFSKLLPTIGAFGASKYYNQSVLAQPNQTKESGVTRPNLSKYLPKWGQPNFSENVDDYSSDLHKPFQMYNWSKVSSNINLQIVKANNIISHLPDDARQEKIVYLDNLDNLASLYEDLGQTELALECSLSSLAMKEKNLELFSTESMYNSYCNLADIYHQLSKFEHVYDTYKKCLELDISLEQQQFIQYGLGHASCVSGSRKESLKDRKLSIKHLDKSIDILNKLENQNSNDSAKLTDIWLKKTRSITMKIITISSIVENKDSKQLNEDRIDYYVKISSQLVKEVKYYFDLINEHMNIPQDLDDNQVQIIALYYIRILCYYIDAGTNSYDEGVKFIESGYNFIKTVEHRILGSMFREFCNNTMEFFQEYKKYDEALKYYNHCPPENLNPWISMEAAECYQEKAKLAKTKEEQLSFMNKAAESLHTSLILSLNYTNGNSEICEPTACNHYYWSLWANDYSKLFEYNLENKPYFTLAKIFAKLSIAIYRNNNADNNVKIEKLLELIGDDDYDPAEQTVDDLHKELFDHLKALSINCKDNEIYESLQNMLLTVDGMVSENPEYDDAMLEFLGKTLQEMATDVY